jgi:hypothetical protein
MKHTTFVVPFQSDSQIRVLTDEQQNPLFVAVDVATALGYRNTAEAIKQHCRGVVKYDPIVDNLGRVQTVRVITEPDLYRLIMGSRLPEAERFERWVFEEVLPAIRKHGRYLHPGTAGPLTGDLLAEVAFAARNAATIVKSCGLALNRGQSRRLVNDMVVESTGVDVLALFAASGLLPADTAQAVREQGLETIGRWAAEHLAANADGMVKFRTLYTRFREWFQESGQEGPLPSKKLVSSWLGSAGYKRFNPGGTATVLGCVLREKEVA